MNALQVMDRYMKEVIQVSTQKNNIKAQYLYDKQTYYYDAIANSPLSPIIWP